MSLPCTRIQELQLLAILSWVGFLDAFQALWSEMLDRLNWKIRETGREIRGLFGPCNNSIITVKKKGFCFGEKNKVCFILVLGKMGIFCLIQITLIKTFMLLTHINGLKVCNCVYFLRLIMETVKHIVMLSTAIIDCQQVSGPCSFCCSCAGLQTSRWAGELCESDRAAQVVWS